MAGSLMILKGLKKGFALNYSLLILILPMKDELTNKLIECSEYFIQKVLILQE